MKKRQVILKKKEEKKKITPQKFYYLALIYWVITSLCIEISVSMAMQRIQVLYYEIQWQYPHKNPGDAYQLRPIVWDIEEESDL